MKRIGILNMILFCVAVLLPMTFESSKAAEYGIEYNPEANTVFLFQSYYTLDYLQREVYVCNCLDSNYRQAVLKSIGEAYKITARRIVELEKVSRSKDEKLNKEVKKYLDVLKLLKKDIDLIEEYTRTKKENDYRVFLENHKELWEKLDKLASRDIKHQVRPGD